MDKKLAKPTTTLNKEARSERIGSITTRNSIKSVSVEHNADAIEKKREIARKQAQEKMKSRTLAPDIVTMDSTMPEMTGVEALDEIKKIDPNAKVVMISAVGQEETIRSAIVKGAKGYIIKPFKEDNVIESLSKL